MPGDSVIDEDEYEDDYDESKHETEIEPLMTSNFG
eukprot:CAMPEP_0201586286 /NCGR_PEP_ID=MMETSP0190_2-20130828/131059_1 /ASSEMBLY_ACC=CAM_ASM_000263 /TAXON_ID=37353 /ORGANISM="Rosalina sp." /LENGTH=34 /DNA_ID= /DNA_START= /DNA_END= /DNA_ORIENTATION=